MAVNFLHGVERIAVNIGPRPVNVVKSAVVGLVGISPRGPRQSLTIVQSAQDAAQFGFWHKDNTIATALRAIQQQGGAFVFVVNVFDEDTHTKNTNETHTVQANKFQLQGLLGDGGVTVVKPGSPAVTLTPGTDYEFDSDTQIGKILNTTDYPDGTTLTVQYLAVELTNVASADVVGAVSGGVRTGLEQFDLAFSQFGFSPKILCVPRYNQATTVASAMLAKADKYLAVALLDAVSGTTVAEALSARGGTAGTIKNFATSSSRAILLYPQLIAEDLYESARTATEVEVTLPLSPFYAGTMAAVDNERGYWKSPSNTEFRGFLRPAVTITASATDAGSTEANLLNEAGITTVFNSFGTGFRIWGNRSAAFPTNTLPENFVPIRRVADITDESLMQASLQFIDEPINNALIDIIKETGNQFLRQQINRGAIIGGQLIYEPSLNPPAQIAAGQLVFTMEYMPPPPLERLTYRRIININFLNQLGS
jgi:phage tail sheath protein FI